MSDSAPGFGLRGLIAQIRWNGLCWDHRVLSEVLNSPLYPIKAPQSYVAEQN